jgi:para-nitrobenzyl esterase
MRKLIPIAILGLALSLGAASAASAQAAPAGPPTVDWTIQDLLNNPGSKAVLDKDLPGMEADPRLQLVLQMTLRAVAQIPDANIDQAKLDQLIADLAALAKH